MTPLHSATGEPIKVLKGHLDQISGIQILSDYRIISVGLDGMIFLWDGTQESHNSDYEQQQNDDWSNNHNDDDNDKNKEIEFIPNILRNYMSDLPL